MAIQDDVETINENLRKVNNNLIEHKDRYSEVQSRLQSVEQIIAKIGIEDDLPAAGGRLTVGARLLESSEENVGLNDLKGWNQCSARLKIEGVSIRAALVNEDGLVSSDDSIYPSQPDRRGIVGQTLRRLSLLEALPSRPVRSDSVEFVQMNSTGDAAEQEGEGAEKQEVDFEGTLVKAPVVTIAAHTTASRQVLSDKAQLQAEIDRVMRHKVRARLEHQLINGNGAANRINGLLNQATTFLPTIGTSTADIIGEALTRQANNGYSPNLVIMNPFDWFRVQITKTNTEEEYLFGSPTAPIRPSLWNTPIVVTPSIAEGKGLTLDTTHTTVLDREQPTVLLSNSHADYFIRNLVKILGELRAGLEVTDVLAVYKMDLPVES